MSPAVAAAADPKAKALAAKKAVQKGELKKKTLKKRFSVTFHRCVSAWGLLRAAGAVSTALEAASTRCGPEQAPQGRRRARRQTASGGS